MHPKTLLGVGIVSKEIHDVINKLKNNCFYVRKQQTQRACLQNRYKKSSSFVKANWFYIHKRQKVGMCSTKLSTVVKICSVSQHKHQTEWACFQIDTRTHQQLLKPIGFTCKPWVNHVWIMRKVCPNDV